MLRFLTMFLGASIISFSANFVLAAEVHLSVGESTTIQSNEVTRVVCGLAPENCDKVVDNINVLYGECRKKDSAYNCFQKHWRTFKVDHPTCSIHSCLVACLENGASAEYCAHRCSN